MKAQRRKLETVVDELSRPPRAPRSRAGRPQPCPSCGAVQPSSIQANTHCSTEGLHDFGTLRPTCFYCSEPMTRDDIRDSRLVGTMPRCRAHLVAVDAGLALAAM